MRRLALLPDMSRRANVQELMEDPACDEARLIRTVASFRAVNRLAARYRTGTT